MKKLLLLYSISLLLVSCNPVLKLKKENNQGNLIKTINNEIRKVNEKNQQYNTQDSLYRSLAEYWAPVFYHDTDSSDYKADLLTKFNFDGDYNGRNNWENLGNYYLGHEALNAYVYYSVVESENFYFIGYYTFHPRDWNEFNSFFTSHENDLEGVLLAIRKNNKQGTLIAAVTEAHNHFYQYKAPGQSLTSGSDNIDGTLILAGSHAKFFIEAKGHGVYAYNGKNAPGGDGIVYQVSNYQAESPDNCQGNWKYNYSYQLIALDNSSGDEGFFYRRNQIGYNNTFASWGIIRGDNYRKNAAKMPWVWDDPDDGEIFSGDMLADPAHFIDCMLNGAALEGMSHKYINNIYASHKIEIMAAGSKINSDPDNKKADIYVKVTADGAAEGSNDIIDSRAWQKNNAAINTFYTFNYSGDNAQGQRDYTEFINTRYFSRFDFPEITIAVFDNDKKEDDLLGEIKTKKSIDYTDGIEAGNAIIKFKLEKLQ